MAEIHTIGRIDRFHLSPDRRRHRHRPGHPQGIFLLASQAFTLSPSARSPTSKERHPGDFERFYPISPRSSPSPDHILQSRKPNTALILKEISTDNQQLKLVLRLATRADQHGYKNSIITFMKIDRKEWDRLLRKKTILYSRHPI